MGQKRVSRTAKLRKVFGHPSKQAQTKLRVGLYARVSTLDQSSLVPSNPIHSQGEGMVPAVWR